jgi:AcrR family transcriptional regulator
MSRSVDERRAQQKEALILAAERRIAAEGSAGLRARDLAQDVGIALGAIYNLVPDLVELRFHVTVRTLRRLDIALEKAASAVPPGDPVAVLIAIAHGYLGFAEDNQNLWRGTFEYLGPQSRSVPEWLVVEQTRLFQRVLAPLAILMPRTTAQERQLFAHTLFTAAHGIVDMGLQQRIFAVPKEALKGQIAFLLRAICDGLSKDPQLG